VSAIRDRTTAQDISDMEYMLELLDGADQAGSSDGERGNAATDMVVQPQSLSPGASESLVPERAEI
jgi:hypothetical protein